jgi:hypothetical protein
MGNSVNVVTSIVNSLIPNCAVDVSETYLYYSVQSCPSVALYNINVVYSSEAKGYC